MNYVESALIEKIAEIFEYAMDVKCYEPYIFAQKWLASETYAKTIDFDTALCSQAKTYILGAFEEEYKDDLPPVNQNSPLYKDDMFWFGYTMAYWHMLENISGNEILAAYDIDKIINEYDVLHTVSVKTAIDLIKEDDRL